MSPRSPSSVPTLRDRASGILLHPTSLPGPFGCGDLGPAATRFARWLARAGQRWWQMLPVGPVGYGNSPYSSSSAFAGNPLLLSLELLEEEGWLSADPPPSLPGGRVDYPRTMAYRRRRLREAFEGWRRADALQPDPSFHRFVDAERSWLDDFALFAALKEAHGGVAWSFWPGPLRDREQEALEAAAAELEEEVLFQRFCQWRFEEQWGRLRRHCEGLGVGLIGDLPIFVAHDSADVWSHRELFLLDDAGAPTVVAGVPPDYFSATGQRWGNPLYRWDRIADEGYGWWIERLRKSLHRFHAIRLDHFIGFVRNWEIPASSATAQEGVWRPGPGIALFDAAASTLGTLPLIAEDLGLVTEEVTALRDALGLPGIRILQFAFGSDLQAPSFRPHNYPRNAVVYTGTHDNDTVEGWFRAPGGGEEEAARERSFAVRYLGACLDPRRYGAEPTRPDPAEPSPASSATEALRKAPPLPSSRLDPTTIHGAMIRAALGSVANLAILPLQDVLGLGGEARMNLPGTLEHNWEWRFESRQLDDALAFQLSALVRIYGRESASRDPASDPGEEEEDPLVPRGPQG